MSNLSKSAAKLMTGSINDMLSRQPIYLGFDWCEIIHDDDLPVIFDPHTGETINYRVEWHEFDYIGYERIPIQLGDKVVVPKMFSEAPKISRVRIWDAPSGGHDLVYFHLPRIEPGDFLTIPESPFTILDD